MTLRADLHIQQGADYLRDLPTADGQGRPRTMAGWTARAAIRMSPNSPLLYSPPTVVRPGAVRITIPGTESNTWTWRRAVYEVLLVGPKGERERLAAGRVLIDPTLIEG